MSEGYAPKRSRIRKRNLNGNTSSLSSDDNKQTKSEEDFDSLINFDLIGQVV